MVMDLPPPSNGLGAQLPAALCPAAGGRLVAPQTTTGPNTPTHKPVSCSALLGGGFRRLAAMRPERVRESRKDAVSVRLIVARARCPDPPHLEGKSGCAGMAGNCVDGNLVV